ncbi:MAG TPA: hypothetical protein VNM69_22015, partial [Bacillus sp. (in: firmicutes)]|nr:hypothetical protein [Bacillus sp. (in: firmicutes)]
STEFGSLFNFPIENTPLALYLLFYQIKNCVSKEPYVFLTYTVYITLPVCGTLLRFAVCFISVPGAGYFDAQFDWLLMIGYQRADFG